MEKDKKLYFLFSDGHDVSNITIQLSGALAWIEADVDEIDPDDPVGAVGGMA